MRIMTSKSKLDRDGWSKATNSERNFRPLSRPQQQSARLDQSMDGMEDDAHPAVGERFLTFEERQKWRDSVGKDIKRSSITTEEENAQLALHRVQHRYSDFSSRPSVDSNSITSDGGMKSEIISLSKDGSKLDNINSSEREQQERIVGMEIISSSKKKKPGFS